jgi:predicted TIM-barrel fold metal-dependent hydrolase
MIIDSNTHITKDGVWFHTAHDASIQRLLEEVSVSGIDFAQVVPLPNVITNDDQSKLIEGKENALIEAFTFNPAEHSTPKEAGEAFRKYFSEKKKSMVKFHNRFGKYHPQDPRFLEVLKVNDQLPTPMVIGVCGLLHDRNSEEAIDTSVYFFNLAKKLEHTELIIMHGGGTRILQIAEMCRDLHHVHFDLSMTLSKYQGTTVSNDISWLCHHYDRRMIWGSDFPEVTIMQAMQDFDQTVGKLGDEKRSNILGNNLSKLLGIS